MTPPEIGLTGVVVLIALTLLRVPLGAAMGLVGLIGYAAIDGWDKAFIVFGTTPYHLTNYSFSVLPLFILMGTVATRSNMSRLTAKSSVSASKIKSASPTAPSRSWS